MKKKELELRCMEYFAENMNLHKNWEIAKECAREIINLRFNDILTGNFDIPPTDELKQEVSKRVPYEFDSEDLIKNGPIDFSGLDIDMRNDAIKTIESIYQKFHNAQTKVVAKATETVCRNLSDNVKHEITQIKKKYL
jgi:hypothetical protein